MAKAYLVTHGETKLDREGRMHGWKMDAPLSWTGQQTAKASAKKLEGKGIKCVYCSPLIRARQTAEIIGKHIGAKVEPRSELMPWNIGNMGGAKASSIKPVLDFFSSRPDRPIPSGESKSAFLSRYKGFMQQMSKEKEPIAIAGHSQHSLGLQFVQKGGDAAKVPVVGGTAGEVKEIKL